MKGINIKLVIATVVTMLPLCVFADNAVSNGINNVSTSVGDTVKDVGAGVGGVVQDVGTGVGNAVTDVGTGVGNAVGDVTPNTTPATPTDTTATAMPTDQNMTMDAQAALTDLVTNKKIADGSNLNVTVANGVVTVSGTVMDSADVDTVKNAMSAVKGVQSVNVDGVKVDGMVANPMSY